MNFSVGRMLHCMRKISRLFRQCLQNHVEIRRKGWYHRTNEILLSEDSDLDKTSRKTGTGFRLTVLVMFALVVLGRSVSYFNTVAATDIAFAAWVSSALSYLAEILVCARTVVAIAGISYAVYHPMTQSGGSYLAAAGVIALLDYAARFLIDFLTNAIVGAEVLAASWLLLQFLFEMLFIALSYLVAGAMRKKFANAETRRQTEACSVNRACMISLLLVLLSRIALEVWYLIDFMLAYTDITATETASIVGSFLKVLVIYGGAALLLGEWYTELLKKRNASLQNVKNA